jgi:hypothetical protein
MTYYLGNYRKTRKCRKVQEIVSEGIRLVNELEVGTSILVYAV